jgi:hypothetical protein
MQATTKTTNPAPYHRHHHHHQLHHLQLDEYLEQVLEAMDPSMATLTITDKHRKTMIRSLLGLTKVEFDQQVRDHQTTQDWKDVEDFCETQLQPILLASSKNDDDDLLSLLLEKAPNFREGLQTYQTFSTHRAPKQKVFAYLARGRAYQGKMERLLQAHKPELLPLYREIVPPPPPDNENDKKDDNKDDRASLKGFVLSKMIRDSSSSSSSSGTTLSETTRRSLRACIDLEFRPPTYPPPADGGKASGLKSEVDLVTYLKKNKEEQQNNKDDDDDDDEDDILILAPLYIVHNAKARNKKKCRYALQVCKSVDLYGMTSEWDAVVVRRLPTTTTTTTTSNGSSSGQQKPKVQILQVWESKASLHAVTIHDVLHKKYDSMRQLFDGRQENTSAKDDHSLTLWMGDESFEVSVVDDDDDRIPEIGIFGATLWSPPASARRAQAVACERLLKSTLSAVEQAIETGVVRIAREEDHDTAVVRPLQQLLDLARELQPQLVVGSMMGQNKEEGSTLRVK